MRSREGSKPARGTLAALRFHLTQEGVRITLHLGDATATADVDGLSLHRHGDCWPHAAQRLACDGTGLLSSIKSLRGRRGRRGGIHRGRIAASCKRGGRGIDSCGSGPIRSSQRIAWCRSSTATAATTAATAAATVVLAAATAAAGEQHERHQGNDHEPSE